MTTGQVLLHITAISCFVSVLGWKKCVSPPIALLRWKPCWFGSLISCCNHYANDFCLVFLAGNAGTIWAKDCRPAIQQTKKNGTDQHGKHQRSAKTEPKPSKGTTFGCTLLLLTCGWINTYVNTVYATFFPKKLFAIVHLPSFTSWMFWWSPGCQIQISSNFPIARYSVTPHAADFMRVAVAHLQREMPRWWSTQHRNRNAQRCSPRWKTAAILPESQLNFGHWPTWGRHRAHRHSLSLAALSTERIEMDWNTRKNNQ